MSADWEWQGDDGLWVPYAPVDSAMLESHRTKRDMKFTTTELTFNAGYGTWYKFDLIALTQRNTESKRVRVLRRVDRDCADSDAGFTRALSGLVAPIATSTVHESAPPPAVKAHKAESFAAAAAAPSAPAVHSTTTAKAGEDTKTPSPDEDADKSSASKSTQISADVIARQNALGAQSLRKCPYDLGPAGKDPHGKYCFDRMLSREKQMCGEWAVFYHSYSHAALLYEVQAAVARVLFRFKSEYATLPRLLKRPFNDISDAPTLLERFPKFKNRDHSPDFRAVGISATSTLIGEDPEAPPKRCFLMGYSCTDLSFTSVLQDLLVSCGVPESMKVSMAKQIVELGAKCGLDVSQFKGPSCKSGRAGHLLQIFVRRGLVNRYAYASQPYGVPDKARDDLEKALERDGPIHGQVRLAPNPSVFMRGSAVRMYVYSADPTFHAGRQSFQSELATLLAPVIGAPDVRVRAATGIYAGQLPNWFNSQDYEDQQKKKLAFVAAS